MGLGEQRNKAIYFRGTREQKSKTEGNRGTKAIRRTGNIENQIFDFGKQGKMPFFFRGTKEQVPTLGGPQYLPDNPSYTKLGSVYAQTNYIGNNSISV